MSSCVEISNISELKELIRNRCDEAVSFLAGKIINGKFDGRSFYGETYAALAMTIFDWSRYNDKIYEVSEWYKNNPKIDDNFHWEFNNYAILKMRQVQEELGKYVFSPLTYRGVKCTNWSMLRCVGLLLEHRSIDNEQIKDKILHMQMENGLILDEAHVASFQYHSFMVALLYELYKLTNDVFYLDKFKKGISFIEKFTLKNGDTLTVGRGQEQIFGYGALIYIYCVAYKELKEPKYLSLVERVFQYVNSFWDKERILPLVLNKYESESDKTLPITDRRHLGWYSYNNYYDYLPFFTYYLVECYSILKEETQDVDIEPLQHNNYADDCFMRYSDLQFDIVMSCKQWASANALCMPYIVTSSGDVTSVCGGDDFVDVGYSQIESISLPYSEYANPFLHIFDSKWYFKKVVKRILKKDKSATRLYLWQQANTKMCQQDVFSEFELKLDSMDYRFTRKMCIDTKKVIIKDEIAFKRKLKYREFVPVNLMLPSKKENEKIKLVEKNKNYLDNSKILFSEKKYSTAKGEVDAITVVITDFAVNNGTKIEYEYILS